ncbi:hypothetical protein RJT34_31203 [Clitoria ternatea]|uniref:Uncharacterized protein n=1 Tax=Clitoria ternatea TaxID=43366 RepID=A0AAN9EY75_CLITE
MSSPSKSVGLRWNYALKSDQQHVLSSRSLCPVRKLSSSSSAMVSCRLNDHHKANKSEESLRTVMLWKIDGGELETRFTEP